LRVNLDSFERTSPPLDGFSFTSISDYAKIYAYAISSFLFCFCIFI
jgi:hypothetical protein